MDRQGIDRLKLDINTPRGEQTKLDERAAIAIFKRHFPMFGYNYTPKDEACDFDGTVYRFENDNVVAFTETKCRYDMDLDKFWGAYKGEWLVTFDKVVKNYVLAKSACVPLYGFLYIVASKALLHKRLWHPTDGWSCEFYVRKTFTQATVNGGLAERDNAFINMNGVEPLL